MTITPAEAKAQTAALLKAASIQCETDPHFYTEDCEKSIDLIASCIQTYCKSELEALYNPVNQYLIAPNKPFNEENFSEWLKSDYYEYLEEDFFGSTYLGSENYANDESSLADIFSFLETIRQFLHLMSSFKAGAMLALDELQDYICYVGDSYDVFCDAWEMSSHFDDVDDEIAFRIICNTFYVLNR